MASPTSPLAALGLNRTLPQPTDPNFWNYERLANSSSDQILSALEMVITKLERKKLICSDLH